MIEGENEKKTTWGFKFGVLNLGLVRVIWVQQERKKEREILAHGGWRNVRKWPCDGFTVARRFVLAIGTKR